jgi:DNA polymerase-3 subunit gamma/tau
MSYLALYREWRPKNFEEVVEQKQAVYALRQAVINNQIAHAYLFSGTRGTGKTTLAKIFSRAINCLNPQDGNPCNECQICKGILDGSLMDVVEMDAASNNSVDNIRRICDEVVFMPSLAKYKVYIVDEVHMLSTGAFNALLKTLEEPPAHAVFILATTEPHRLPATILSRCQRYDFRRIPLEGITARLREISAADNIQLTDEALEAIASFADGAMRDAISLLDQARASIPGKIERNDVLALAGITQDDFMMEMSEAVLEGKISTILRGIDELVMSGRDLSRFVTDLAQFFRNLLIVRFPNNRSGLFRQPIKH